MITIDTIDEVADVSLRKEKVKQSSRRYNVAVHFSSGKEVLVSNKSAVGVAVSLLNMYLAGREKLGIIERVYAGRIR